MSELRDRELMFADVLYVQCEGDLLVPADRYYSGEALVEWLRGCAMAPAFASYCDQSLGVKHTGVSGVLHFFADTGTLRACDYPEPLPFVATLEGWEVFKSGVRQFCDGMTDEETNRELHLVSAYFVERMRRTTGSSITQEDICPCIDCTRQNMRRRQYRRRLTRNLLGMRVYRNRDRAERLIMTFWGNYRFHRRHALIVDFLEQSANVVDCRPFECYLWKAEAVDVYVDGGFVWLPLTPTNRQVRDIQSYYSELGLEVWWSAGGGWVVEPRHDEDDENDDDDNQSNYIPDYHSVSRPWRRRTIQPYEMGIEVEAFCYERGALAADVCMITSAFDETCFAERDGSLDSSYGIESVTPPTYLEDAKRLAVELSEALRTHDAKVPNNEYGLHVSICTHEWSILHLGKFEAFLNVNQDVCELIARRARNHWCQPVEGGFTGRIKRFKRHSRFDRSRGHGMMREVLSSTSGHYDLVQLGASGRAEVRMFRSSTKAINLVGAIEFVHAVASYTRDCSVSQTADGGVCDLPAFWRFCWERRKRDYPNLFKYALECGVDTSLPIRNDRLEKIQKSGVVA